MSVPEVVTLGELQGRFEAAGWRFSGGERGSVVVAERDGTSVYAPSLRRLLRELARKYPTIEPTED